MPFKVVTVEPPNLVDPLSSGDEKPVEHQITAETGTIGNAGL